jgi:hypothetical protein
MLNIEQKIKKWLTGLYDIDAECVHYQIFDFFSLGFYFQRMQKSIFYCFCPKEYCGFEGSGEGSNLLYFLMLVSLAGCWVRFVRFWCWFPVVTVDGSCLSMDYPLKTFEGLNITKLHSCLPGQNFYIRGWHVYDIRYVTGAKETLYLRVKLSSNFILKACLFFYSRKKHL